MPTTENKRRRKGKFALLRDAFKAARDRARLDPTQKPVAAYLERARAASAMLSALKDKHPFIVPTPRIYLEGLVMRTFGLWCPSCYREPVSPPIQKLRCQLCPVCRAVLRRP